MFSVMKRGLAVFAVSFLFVGSALAEYRYIGTSSFDIPTKYVKDVLDTVILGSKDRGLLDNRVLDVTADNRGNVAFATMKGVSVYNNGNWNNYPFFEGMNDSRVLSVTYNSAGDLFAATIEGVVRIDQNGTAVMISSDPTYKVVADDHGNIFTTTDNGAAKYDSNKKWTYFDASSTDMDFGRVYGIFGDDEIYWFGADRLMRISRSGKQTFYRPMDYLPRIFKAINMDGKYRMWYGSHNGLLMNNDGTWIEYGLADGLPSENINDIVIDNKGAAWFATDNGIAEFTGTGFKKYDFGYGILDPKITGIAFDNQGRLWYSSLKGVGVLKGNQFENIFATSLFKDIESVPWASSFIQRLEKLKIIKGYDDGNFHPNYNITRAEILKIAINASGSEIPEVNGAGYPFYDVRWSEDWFAAHAQWAHVNRIFDLQDQNTFNANQRTTRIEALRAIMYAFNATLDYSGVSQFVDVNQEDSVFVNAAVSSGLLGGYSDGTFRPYNLITRAEITKIISNAIDAYGRQNQEVESKEFVEDEAAARLQGSKTNVLQLQQIIRKYKDLD